MLERHRSEGSRGAEAPRRGAALAIGLLLVLAGTLLLAAAATAREIPTYFERDYETAEKLHELYEQIQDADTLFMLDSIDAAITGGGCRDEHFDYSEALAEVTKLADRKRAGEQLTYDEERYYEDEIEAEARLWKEFEDCYTAQLRLPAFASGLPPGIDSYAKAVATYDELRQERGWQQEGGFDAVVAQIEKKIDELESEPAYIATVTNVFRRVEMSRKGGPFKPLNKGDQIMLRDLIRTGPKGRTRLELHDRNEEKNVGPTVVLVGNSTEFEMHDFGVHWDEDKSFFEHLAELGRGVVRAFTKGFGARAAFSVRTGTSLCGIRGTEVEIEYVPELDEVTYKLFEGFVEVTTPGGKVTLEPGRAMTVRDGVPGPMRSLDEPQA